MEEIRTWEDILDVAEALTDVLRDIRGMVGDIIADPPQGDEEAEAALDDLLSYPWDPEGYMIPHDVRGKVAKVALALLGVAEETNEMLQDIPMTYWRRKELPDAGDIRRIDALLQECEEYARIAQRALEQ
jgi:hypothetical protein